MNNKLKLLGVLILPMALAACNGGGGGGGEDGCPRGMERENGVCVKDNDDYRNNDKFKPDARGDLQTQGLYKMIRDSENVATIDQRGNVIFWDDYHENDRNIEARANVRPKVQSDKTYYEHNSCRKGESYGYVRAHQYRFNRTSHGTQFTTNCGDDNGGTYQQQSSRAMTAHAQTIEQQLLLTSVNGHVIEITNNTITNEDGTNATLNENGYITNVNGGEDCEQEYIFSDDTLAILPSDICQTATFKSGIYYQQ